MKMGLSEAEGRVLHGLLEEASGDVVVRLDSRGFIVYVSENASELGRDFSSLLLMPHISDLAEPEHKNAVNAYAHRVLSGESGRGWIEFPIAAQHHANEVQPADPVLERERRHRWFALNLRPIKCEDGSCEGALGLLRSVQHLRALEGELHARAITDPLTGLANRHAFCASLRRHLAQGGGQVAVVFAVDRLRAIFMQYGQRTADEIQCGFAKFLETMALPGHEIAQIDHERFGVILPDMSTAKAREWAEDVLRTFSALTIPSTSKSPKLSASGGLAQVECTVDWTLRQAELALVMARAGGGMRVEYCHHTPVANRIDAGDRDWLSPDRLGVAASGR